MVSAGLGCSASRSMFWVSGFRLRFCLGLDIQGRAHRNDRRGGEVGEGRGTGVPRS